MGSTVERITIQGSAQLPATATGPVNVGQLAPLPQDGSWAITGKIGCVDTLAAPARGGARAGVTFFPQFEGVSIEGAAARLDSYGSTDSAPPMPCQPQDRGAAGGEFGAVVPNPILVVTGNQLQLEVQATPPSEGVVPALTWWWDLVLTRVTLT